jgi:pimeloyl-ACP methyl ester carboxylesterase
MFVCHGRGRTLDSQSTTQWKALAELENVTIVLHNYPCYGKTPGPSTVHQIQQDCIDILNHVRGQDWARGKEVVLLGNSIGCGPTLALARQKDLDIKKVVVVSPYTSLSALV